MTMPAAAGLADAAALAAIHAACFTPAWSAEDFKTLLAAPGARAFMLGPDGFILVRAVKDEAEIITLAVLPAAQNKGLGTVLARHAIAALREQGIATLHLEVGADNSPARALYARLGFAETGRRPGYYRQGRDAPKDALILSLALAAPARPGDGSHLPQNPI